MQKILFLLLLVPIFVNAQIINTDSFADLLKYADENTLVLTDIDNTLLETEQLVGTVQWEEHMVQELSLKGKSKDEIAAIISGCWLKLKDHLRPRLVDPNAEKIIKELQNKGIRVLALTARDKDIAEFTINQLNTLKINLCCERSNEEFLLPMASSPALFKSGILFTGMNNSKGEVLKAFLSHHQNSLPKKIIFIDDKLGYIQSVEKHLADSGIDFIGLRYGGADHRVKTFNPNIAEIQFKALPQIISDEEAAAMHAEQLKVFNK